MFEYGLTNIKLCPQALRFARTIIFVPQGQDAGNLAPKRAPVQAISQMGTASTFTRAKNASTARSVDSNMNVPDATKHIPVPNASRARQALKTETNLPTPIRTKKLEHYLSGYDPNIAQFLISGFTNRFSIQYQGSQTLTVHANHKSALNPTPNCGLQNWLKKKRLGASGGRFPPHHFLSFGSHPWASYPRKNRTSFVSFTICLSQNPTILA